MAKGRTMLMLKKDNAGGGIDNDDVGLKGDDGGDADVSIKDDAGGGGNEECGSGTEVVSVA